jgi:hypothetical protein
MDHDAGMDVSLEQSSVCAVDATGRIVREAKVASEPEALITFLRSLNLPLVRIGLEAEGEMLALLVPVVIRSDMPQAPDAAPPPSTR